MFKSSLTYGRLALLVLLAFTLVGGACRAEDDDSDAPKKKEKKKKLSSDELDELAENIEVFITGKPDRPYKELSVISDSSVLSQDQSKCIKTLKRKAVELGGDGIILLSSGTKQQDNPTVSARGKGWGFSGLGGGTRTTAFAEAIVIKWKAEAPAATPAPAKPAPAKPAPAKPAADDQ